MPDPARMTQSVTSKGAVIEVIAEGRGPALVVLPSYGRDGTGDYDRFAERVAAAGFSVLRPQPRGVLGSRGDMDASLANMAEDVAAVVTRLGGGRAFVLGHAFGNSVARLLAQSHGELVGGVVLAAASGSGASKLINETPFVAGDPSLPEPIRLAALSTAFFAPQHDARAWLDGWYPPTLRMQKAAADAIDPKDFSGAGHAPILQIIAESDPFNPFSSWRELREQCGDRVTTRIVADASHALFPEQPEDLAARVVEWMRSH